MIIMNTNAFPTLYLSRFSHKSCFNLRVTRQYQPRASLYVRLLFSFVLHKRYFNSVHVYIYSRVRSFDRVAVYQWYGVKYFLPKVQISSLTLVYQLRFFPGLACTKKMYIDFVARLKVWLSNDCCDITKLFKNKTRFISINTVL